MAAVHGQSIWDDSMASNANEQHIDVDLSRFITGMDSTRFLRAPTWLGLNPRSTWWYWNWKPPLQVTAVRAKHVEDARDQPVHVAVAPPASVDLILDEVLQKTDGVTAMLAHWLQLFGRMRHLACRLRAVKTLRSRRLCTVGEAGSLRAYTKLSNGEQEQFTCTNMCALACGHGPGMIYGRVGPGQKIIRTKLIILVNWML